MFVNIRLVYALCGLFLGFSIGACTAIVFAQSDLEPVATPIQSVYEFVSKDKLASSTAYKSISFEDQVYAEYDLQERILLELQSINTKLEYLTFKY